MQNQDAQHVGGFEKDKKHEQTKEEAKKQMQKYIDDVKKQILEDNPLKGIEIARQALKELKEPLGGENSIYLIPIYIVLAEANLKDGKIQKAGQYLGSASWNFFKSNKSEEQKEMMQSDGKEDIANDETFEYRRQLAKTFSKLFLAQNNSNKALDELKKAVYMESLKYGPENLLTTSSYYQMGQIFEQKRQYQEAENFYGKYAHIWCMFVKKTFFKSQQDPAQFQTEVDFDLLVKEALYYLKQIEQFFEHHKSQNDKIADLFQAETFYSLAGLYMYQKEDEMNQIYLTKTLESYNGIYGQNHSKTQKILQYLEMAQQDDQDAENDQQDF